MAFSFNYNALVEYMKGYLALVYTSATVFPEIAVVEQYFAQKVPLPLLGYCRGKTTHRRGGIAPSAAIEVCQYVTLYDVRPLNTSGNVASDVFSSFSQLAQLFSADRHMDMNGVTIPEGAPYVQYVRVDEIRTGEDCHAQNVIVSLGQNGAVYAASFGLEICWFEIGN